MSLPSGVLVHNETWEIVQGVRDNGPGISGQTQRIQTGGLPWRVTYELIIPHAAVMAWNLWIMQQRDGIVPVMLRPTLYRSEAKQYFAPDGGFSDTTEFSDGTGFAADLDPPEQVTLNGAHSAGDIEVSIERYMGDGAESPSAAGAYTPGEYISMGLRLHRITSVAEGSPAHRYATLGIWPPLRADLSDGSSVHSPPRTKMRLEEKGSGTVPDRAYGVHRLTLSFIEYLGDASALE